MVVIVYAVNVISHVCARPLHNFYLGARNPTQELPKIELMAGMIGSQNDHFHSRVAPDHVGHLRPRRPHNHFSVLEGPDLRLEIQFIGVHHLESEFLDTGFYFSLIQ
ncbi:hypothetical protein BKP43_41860 [Variovorax boronicumulans]|nr:hypothetical protein BKP43_41860 [Variovorax boronicumulans]